jgi:hypothetical protein
MNDLISSNGWDLSFLWTYISHLIPDRETKGPEVVVRGGRKRREE